MSAIAGLVRFDEAPVDGAVIHRMCARLALRGLAMSAVTDGATGLVYGASGAGEPHQPLVNPRGLSIVFDGRLDNHADLRESLRLPGDAGDAALALAAYEKWGVDFAAQLLGDFAVAIVDPPAHQLVCARDVFGIRRLHYRIGNDWIAFSSSIDAITATIAPMPAINEGMVGEYLSTFIVSESETLYADVFRLPAAHVLVATPDRVRTSRYYRPTPSPPGQADDRAYEEQLRALLTQAVADRLRTPHPAGVLLSGGLDSSSITGIAASLVRDGAVVSPRIETFSGVGEGDGNEQPYSSAVRDQWALTAHHITEVTPTRGDFRAELEVELEAQNFPHTPTMDALRQTARDRGVRTLLTGMGGDDWLGSGPAAYSDLARRGRLITLARRIYSDLGSDRFAGPRETVRSIIWPFLSASAQQAVRLALRRGQAPPWIDRQFARRIDLRDRLARYRPEPLLDSFEQNANWFESTNGFRMQASETVVRGADRFGLVIAHPYFDRRVVEFCLSLPPDQLWRDGREKDLLRRSMRDFVPPQVAARLTSPSADHAFVDAIAAEAGQPPFRHLQIEQRGWIDGAAVRGMYRGWTARPAAVVSESRILWGLQAIELWLDARSMVKYSHSQGD